MYKDKLDVQPKILINPAIYAQLAFAKRTVHGPSSNLLQIFSNVFLVQLVMFNLIACRFVSNMLALQSFLALFSNITSFLTLMRITIVAVVASSLN